MKISLPEQVWIDLEPATFASRFLAYTNDFLIRWGTVLILFLCALLLTAYLGTQSPWKILNTALDIREHQDLLIAFAFLFFFLVEWSYPIYFEVFRGGVTPGKAILGLQVVDERGLPLTFRTSFLRTTFLLVDSMPALGIVGLISMMFTKNHQRLGDLVAKTMVVHQSHLATKSDSSSEEGEQILIPLDIYSVLEKFLARKKSLAQEARQKTADKLVEKLIPFLPQDFSPAPIDTLGREAWLETVVRRSAPRKNSPQRRSQDPFMNWKQVGAQLDAAQALLASLKESRKEEVRSKDTLVRAAEQFQGLCQLYSYLSTFYPTTAQAARAAQLVRTGRTLFYGHRLRSLEERKTAFFDRAAKSFSLLKTHTALATAISVLAGFVAAAFVFINPALVYSLLPEATLDDLQRGHLWTEEVRGWSKSGSTQIMTNNIKVSFFCFVSGISAGVITIIILIQNGANVGALLAATSYYKMNYELLQFMLAHGFLEISIIMVSSGCGLYLGDGLIKPGSLSRLSSLQQRANDVAPLVIFNAAGLILAGYVEGHISPYAEYSLGSKLFVGLTIASLYWLILLRWKQPAQKRSFSNPT